MNDEIYSGKKIRTMRGKIIEAIKETPDTWTLVIKVNSVDKNYLAGQFISIDPKQFPELRDFVRYFEHQKGKKEPIRAYSLTSAPYEEHIAITIKPESYEPGPDAFPPLLSPFLASNIFLGRELEFIGYSGAYVMPEQLRENSNHVVHLVAGSGVVPSFSIIKDELVAKKSSHHHTLIFVNKAVQDIIFHEELKKLSAQFPKQLRTQYFLTKEHQALGDNYFAGRPSLAQMAPLFHDKEKTILFACGPAITKWQKKAAKSPEELKPRFMEWVQEVVDAVGLDKHRFKREVYG